MAIPDARFSDVYYPETDGEPMAETDTHRNLMMDLIFSLSEYFKDNPEVYVSGNILLYYEEGDPRKSVSPDVLVVKGIEKHERPIYKLWEESKAPDVVIELTSKSTRTEDLGTKKGLYTFLGVKEYFIFDPFSEYLKPHLRGYRLSGDEYAQMKGNRIICEELGLELKVEENSLRLYEIFSGKKLLTPAETAKAKEEAERELEREREEHEREREEHEREREEHERELERERRAREREFESRRKAEEEMERLKAELDKLNKRKKRI